jgi:hypothetical protein
MMGGRLSWRFARYERVAADHASWAERGLHAARRAFGRDSHTRYVGVGARLLQLVGYLFCIAAVFVGIAAGILTLISSRLSARGRIAGRSPLSTCAQVSAAAGPGPYRLSGHTGNPAQGDFPAPLSGMLCVWYRLRVHRRYRTTVMRPDNEGDWREFEVLAEEPVWEWDCGPFPVQDATGAALVAPALLEHSTALSPRPGGQRGASADLAAGFGRAMAAEPTASTAYQWVKDLAKDRYPARTTVNELYQEGAEESRYRSGAIGTLRAHALLPDSLLRHFADPATKTLGYRVTEETIPPGLPLNVFALATVVGGRTILTNPFADVPALSVEQLPSVLASGARRSARWIVLLAITALLLLAATLILLVPTVRSGR